MQSPAVPKGRSLKDFFDEKVHQYNRPEFIKDDPVCIPHLFTRKQDIEIAGFLAATISWGFCLHHNAKDLQSLTSFKHRTFNSTDLLYFIAFLQYHYSQHSSLEDAFMPGKKSGNGIEWALTHFHNYFFSLEHVPNRTRKHIATPYKGSTCKRLNMYLRWMVRKDRQGVDFGIWKKIRPAELICPIDLHVARVAKRFGLLDRKQIDWQAAVELTGYLRTLDPSDPVKYDFALFGLGVMEKY